MRTDAASWFNVYSLSVQADPSIGPAAFVDASRPMLYTGREAFVDMLASAVSADFEGLVDAPGLAHRDGVSRFTKRWRHHGQVTASGWLGSSQGVPLRGFALTRLI